MKKNIIWIIFLYNLLNENNNYYHECICQGEIFSIAFHIGKSEHRKESEEKTEHFNLDENRKTQQRNLSAHWILCYS